MVFFKESTMARPMSSLLSQTIDNVDTIGNDVLIDTHDTGDTTKKHFIKRPNSESFYKKDGVFSPAFGPLVTDASDATLHSGNTYESLVAPFFYTDAVAVVHPKPHPKKVAAAHAVAPPRILRMVGMLSCGFSVMDHHRLIVKVEF